MKYGPPAISGTLFMLAALFLDQASKSTNIMEKGAFYIVAGVVYIGVFIALQQGWILAAKARK